jgi:hypothetical protein
MDKGSTIIGLGIIVLTIIPFIIYYLYKKMKKMKFLKDFVRLSEREKFKISQKEMWKNCYAIAIDTESKKLLYFNKLKDKEKSALIDLSKVERCRIVSTDRTVKNLNENNIPTNRLELVFTFNNSAMPEKVLEFYNRAEFRPSADEFSHIESWLNIVNSNLKI